MRIEEVAGQAIGLVPALSRLRMLRCWAGTTDMTCDGAPIIDETPVANLHINGGWCYGGFKAICGSGWVFADQLATGRVHDLARPFSLDRFATGAMQDEAAVGPMPNHR